MKYPFCHIIKRSFPGFPALAIIFVLCILNDIQASPNHVPAKAGITKEDWGETDGKKVNLYTLTNKNGIIVKVTNYGGTITSWITPDRSGNKSNIVIGFDSLKSYLNRPPYFGATIGRYGNRIGN